MKGFLLCSDDLIKKEADESHVGDMAPKSKVLHVTDSHLQSIVNYNNYSLL